MPREIKFRAWNSKKQYMEYGSNSLIFDCYYMEQDCIMQYTGLKDCKVQEIYEGDIVRVEDAENRTVAYGLASFHLVSSVTGSRILLEDRSQELLEVIGNIYEHHDFLEEKPRD